MVKKFKNLNPDLQFFLLLAFFMIFAVTTGIIVALNWTPRNENSNLKLTFDYGCYRGTYFEGDVVFKKDFEDVSLDMSYKPDPHYLAYPSEYNLHLTDKDGNEVTNVAAGKTYHFYARLELDRQIDYKVYSAGTEVSNNYHTKLYFKSGSKTLYTVRY